MLKLNLQLPKKEGDFFSALGARAEEAPRPPVESEAPEAKNNKVV